MQAITFENVKVWGEIVEDNASFTHWHAADFLERYDSNFIAFKQLPTVDVFQQAETYLAQFHQQRGQHHLKFYLPDNTYLQQDLQEYTKAAGYLESSLELYAIEPHAFRSKPAVSTVIIEEVTKENLEELIALKYAEDLQFGEQFAKNKEGFIRLQFQDEAVQQLIAFEEGIAVGYVDVHLTQTTAEIDELTVKEAFQKRGIGSQLQQFVMTAHADKIVLLLAEADDTPREMYRKQNYKYLGNRMELLKESLD